MAVFLDEGVTQNKPLLAIPINMASVLDLPEVDDTEQALAPLYTY